MTDHSATPPDVVKARIRALLATDDLTRDEAAEWRALTAAYRSTRRAERQATS